MRVHVERGGRALRWRAVGREEDSWDAQHREARCSGAAAGGGGGRGEHLTLAAAVSQADAWGVAGQCVFARRAMGVCAGRRRRA